MVFFQLMSRPVTYRGTELRVSLPGARVLCDTYYKVQEVGATYTSRTVSLAEMHLTCS